MKPIPTMHLLLITFAIAFLLAGPLHAQQIEDVLVERYHVQDDPAGSGEALVTYRIFLDLPEGYRLLMVFGDEKNDLHFTTTTEFFNDTTDGTVYADKLDADKLNTGSLALDSWLTMGAASNRHLGVPLALDADGSILECPPYGKGSLLESSPDRSPRYDLCRRDGLMQVDSVPQVMAFRFEPGYLNKVRGGVVHTMSGAWGIMGGMKGATPENIVLIAQLSTTGVLTFAINVEVLDPQGKVIRIVHDTPQHVDQVQDPRLQVGLE